jgi:hypothetical protein
MVSFTTSTVAIITAFSLAQPIAAGPLALIGTAVSTVVSIAGSHKARGETDLWTRNDDIQSEFAACMSAAHQGTPPKMTINPDKTIDMTGLPPVCMSELSTYNSQPNIAAMNAAQGTATITGPNSVHISGLQGHLTAYLESLAKSSPSQGNKQAGQKHN